MRGRMRSVRVILVLRTNSLVFRQEWTIETGLEGA
jgi:hypothetical protein